jgi:hypothetical protein
MLGVRRQDEHQMLILSVTITKFIDDHYPGWVECKMVDAAGKEWIFNEKVTVVSADNLNERSVYPQPGFIACAQAEKSTNQRNENEITVSTLMPWGVETVDGNSLFTVRSSQVHEKV